MPWVELKRGVSVKFSGVFEKKKIALTLALQDDGDDEAVDTQNTSHNDWNKWLEDQFWLQDTHAANTDTGLGGTVWSSQVAENEGRGDTHETEEGVLVWIVAS